MTSRDYSVHCTTRFPVKLFVTSNAPICCQISLPGCPPSCVGTTSFGVAMPDHAIRWEPRLLDQMPSQIHAVKPGLMDRSSQISILVRLA